MKIAIPVEEKNINTDVCVSFGRTPYFLIFDTENQIEEYIENPAAEEKGGAGVKAGQIIVDSGADAVIIPMLGQNAANILIAGNIKIFRSEKVSAKNNIDLLINNKLSQLTSFHAGFYGNGGF